MPTSSTRLAGAVKPRRARSMRWLLAAAALGLGWLLALAPAAIGQAPTVLVTRVAGPITPVGPTSSPVAFAWPSATGTPPFWSS